LKAIKKLLVVLVAGGLGFAGAIFWIGHRQGNLPAPDAQIAAAQTETAGEAGTPRVAARPAAALAEPAPAANQRSPEDILNELAGIQVTPGLGQGRAQYRIMSLLDQLAQCGQSALPAIRAFLASGRDVAYNVSGTNSMTAGGGRARNRNNTSLLPPSLRFALLDVVSGIGGTGAEEIFAESLNSTVKGSELLFLVQALEAQYPGKYRDTAIAAAKNLLAGGKITDGNDRNNLYDLLRQFNDTSYTATARAQLIQPDGTVDRSALRYLQQTLGEQSLGVAAQAWQDGRVKDADSKEAIGRIGLTYVGAADNQVNDQAVQLFHAAINDPSLSPEQRQNLIEDLNQDGLSNRRNPTPDDLKIIANRYQLAQWYLQQPSVQNDPTFAAPFTEANKDLVNLLQRAGLLK
jgi:hypothetical protein